jgi:Secretion system C-terminal sorting domain
VLLVAGTMRATPNTGGTVANDLVPSEFFVGQNYPNPFKEKTSIKYCLPSRMDVTITITDSNGKIIEQSSDKAQDPGTYEVEFNATSNRSGERRSLPKGIYFCQVKAGNYSATKKMALLR